MDQRVRQAKAQEPWIGSRGRIGVIIPSTNIGVEYDCQRIIPPGVPWHFARFFVEQPDLSSDNLFLAFIDAIRKTIPDAVRDIITCEPSYIMMGMSAETFWGGLEGNAEFEARLRSAREIIEAKLPKRTRNVLAMPPAEQRKLVMVRKRMARKKGLAKRSR